MTENRPNGMTAAERKEAQRSRRPFCQVRLLDLVGQH